MGHGSQSPYGRCLSGRTIGEVGISVVLDGVDGRIGFRGFISSAIKRRAFTRRIDTIREQDDGLASANFAQTLDCRIDCQIKTRTVAGSRFADCSPQRDSIICRFT